MAKREHALLKRAKAEGTPLIDGSDVTFVWEGDEAPVLINDQNAWGGEGVVEMTKAAPGVWSHTITVEPDSYLEYAFVNPDGRVPDPHNPRLTTNGMGEFNHYADLPATRHTPLIRRGRGVTAGKVTQHRINGGFAIVGDKRPVYLYQPPTTEPVPLLVVLDGNDFFKRAKLAAIVDNLIAKKRIPPIAIAGVAHGGQARFVEYLCSDATLAFLIRDVFALAREHLNLVEPAGGRYGIMGASMGGLMSLYAGLRMPDIFGSVISFSGAFGFGLGGHRSVVHDLVELYPPRPLNLWMNVGRYEWLLEPNRHMREALTARGYSFTYREYSGGHNYTCWRDELPLALEAVYGR
jgi:enterochelin esterase-like enzyme